MMLLNLSSPNMQRTLRAYIIFAVVRTLVLSIVCTAALSVILVWLSTTQLQLRAERLKLESEQSSLLLSKQAKGSVTETTQRLNSQLRVLLDVQKRYTRLSPLIDHVARITPDEITLNGMTCDIVKGSCILGGVAATREAYTAYEKTLEASAAFANVHFPLVTKRTDIDFTVDIQSLFTF